MRTDGQRHTPAAQAAAAGVPTSTAVSGPGVQVECRVWPRYVCGAPATCQSVASRATKDLPWSAVLHDISAGGVGLTINRRFEPGAALAIELPESATGPAVTVLAQVVHATPLRNGKWRLGCSLVHELDGEELQTLVSLGREAPAPPPRAKEPVLERLNAACDRSGQPFVERLRRPAKTLVIPLVSFQGPAGSGAAKSLLVRRLHLIGSWPLAAGSLLNVRIPAAGASPGDVALRIEDCSTHDGRWTVRYAFVTPPPPEVLTLFGPPTPEG